MADLTNKVVPQPTTATPGTYDRRGVSRPASQAEYRAAYWAQEIPRLPLAQRRLHWIMAIGGIAAMISGIGWFWREMNWVLALFGGGVAARLVHVVTGTVFSVLAVYLIGKKWGPEILKFQPYDREWMRTGGGYMTPQKNLDPNVHHEHAPAGFFNAGQKMLGWMYVALAVLLFATGIVMWWPEVFGPTLVRLALPLHGLGFVLFGAGLIMHVYLSTAANPGTFRAIVTGKVTRLWAHDHHPKWFEQVVEEERRAKGK